MAAEGWMLESYHEKNLNFVAMPPKKLTFAVTFFKDYNYLGHTAPEDLKYMWQLCETDGWKNITHNDYIQIFYNETPDAAPFHTDAVVQLENFNSLIEVSLLKKWRFFAHFMFFFMPFLPLISLFTLAESGIDRAQFITTAVFAVILGGYLVYEMVYCIFRCVKYGQWYKKAVAAARDENCFLAPFENIFYDRFNFDVTAAFCISFAVAMFVFGGCPNVLGIDGSVIALNSVKTFVFSRIFVSLKVSRAEDDGFVVRVRDKYPTNTAFMCLGVAIVLWIIWLVN